MPLDGFHVSRSLKRNIHKNCFSTTINHAFVDVMKACSNRPDTWITKEFISAYSELHRRGFAHSVEVWKNDVLAGGVYGVSINGAFFAESMFHHETDASKIALYRLVEKMNLQAMTLLEVQFMTPHLKSLGAIEITDQDYMTRLETALSQDANFAGPTSALSTSSTSSTTGENKGQS